MEDYELTIGTIEYYKDKACQIVNDNCNKCEAMYECKNSHWCCFDIVTRFIEWDNKYNK